MIRILGAITGSALALATLLVVIGVPQFKTESTASEHSIVTLPRPTSPVEPADTRVVDAAEPPQTDAAIASEPEIVASAGEQAAAPGDATAHDATVAVSTGSADHLVETIDASILVPQSVLDTPQSWYAFWSPFRSELAANGFVAQLQSVTGLDYRVVRVKPGVYEVAFAYENDDDISANLTQITAATGLELPQ